MKLIFTLFLSLTILPISLAWTKINGNIRGIVTNKNSGETIRGATIRLISFKSKKAILKSVSKDVGEFLLFDVPPGLYDLECTAFGYKTTRIVGIKVNEDRTKLAYFKLERGAAADVNEIYTYAALEGKQKALIETGSTNNESIEDAPATIYVVTNEDIETRGYMALSDVLVDIPEIEIQNRSNPGSYNTISVRGISGNEKLLLLINGKRANSMASSTIAIDYNYNIRYAERIEIILGPASALYGADAYTGVVNIITKEAYNAKNVSITTSNGLYSTTANSLYVGLGNKDISFSLTGGFYYSKEPELHKIYTNDFRWYNEQYSQNGHVLISPFDPNMGTKKLKIQPFDMSRFAYFINAEFKYKDLLTLGFYTNRHEHSSSTSIKPEYSPYTSFARYGSVTTGFFGSFFYQPKNDKRWSLETVLNVAIYAIPSNSHFSNNFSSYKNSYKLGSDTGERLQSTFKYQFNQYHKLAIGLNVQHTLALPKTADLPFKYEHNPWTIADPNADGIYYPGTNVTDANGNSLRIIQDFYYVRRFMAGAFAEYRLNIKEKLLITLGFRFDQVIDISEYQTSEEKIHIYNSLNPRAGIVYKPSDNFRIKLFYGEGFLEPSPQRKYEHFGSFEPVLDNAGNYTHIKGGLWRVPNEQLLPEKVRTAEFSTKYIKGNFSITGSGYFNILENLVVLETNFDNQTFKGVPIIGKKRPVNSNVPVYTYGATLTSNYQVAFGKKEQLKLNIRASYTYADGKEVGLNHFPLMAMHTIKTGLLFRFHDFSIYNTVLYRSAGYSDGSQDANGAYNQQSIPPFAVWNAFLRYKILKQKKLKLDAFVKLNNILNSKYYHLVDNTPNALRAAPQDPIRFEVGFTIGFEG